MPGVTCKTGEAAPPRLTITRQTHDPHKRLFVAVLSKYFLQEATRWNQGK
jgi:hypothetical protein